MRNLFFAWMLLAAGLVPQLAVAEENLVVIVFDANRAIAASKAGQSMAKQLSTQINKVRADAEKSGKSLRDEAAKIEEQRSLMAQDALQSKIAAFRTKEAEQREKFGQEAAAIRAGGEAAQDKIVESDAGRAE